MATATSIVMNNVDQASNKSTRSITHVNPSATQTELKNFVEGLNGLTTNTLADARRVDTTDIINDERLSHNLTVTPATISASEITTSLADTPSFSITGSAIDLNRLQVSRVYDVTDPSNALPMSFGWGGTSDGDNLFFITKDSGSGDPNCTITITLPEDSVYQEATATIKVTE